MPASSYVKREHAGGAVDTTITADITSSGLTINLASSTGWPSGGANGPFHVIVDYDIAGKEKIEIQSRTGTTLTVADAGKRGIDGTAAAGHLAGAKIRHCNSALEADEWSKHVANDSGMVKHTAVALAADSVTATQIAANAVTTAKVLDGNVTLAKLAANSVDASKIVDGSVGNTELAAGAVTAAKIAAGTITATELAADSVGASELADNSVAQANMLDNSVGTAELIDSSVTRAKLNDDITVGDVEIATGPADTNVNNDGVYVSMGSRAITLESPAVVAISPTASLRAESNVGGQYDWRARIRVGGADHPKNALYGIIDGWIENGSDDANTHFLSETIFWPLGAGTHTATFEFLVAGGSAGGINVRDPKLKLAELNFG